MSEKDPRWQALRILDTDYAEYGDKVERWRDPRVPYPDCSGGCKHWLAWDGDWGICSNKQAPRFGLLTWEHQAGVGCFSQGGRLDPGY